MTTKHVVKYSMGKTSAVAGALVIEQHGRENTIWMFNNTHEEADDCYRFGREVAVFHRMPITEVNDGRTVTQLFIDQKFLGNNSMTMCSRMLKKEPGERFMTGLIEQGFDVITYEGMSLPDDAHRIAGRREVYANLGIEVRFPLIERGLAGDDCKRIITEEWGIRLSSSYEHFEHDNCLKRGCVKGGLEYWGLIALYLPNVWEKAASEEDSFKRTILSSHRYGKYPLGSLRRQRERSIRAARKYEQRKATGQLDLPMLVMPCICAT